MWLTRLALRNPVLILMLSLMTIVLGVVCLGRLGVDLFPALDIPQVRVATFYTGAGPEVVEKAVSQPIERAVAACPGVDRVESVSRQGVSAVTVWFKQGTNLDAAQFDVSQRVAQVQSSLPPGIQAPYILKFDVTNIPVVQLTLSSDELDEKQLYDLAYNTIEPQLERLPGVASATVGGGRLREIEVAVDADAARARGLGLLDVVQSVKSANLLVPGGRLASGDRDYNVFTNSQVEKVRTLEDVVLRSAAGALTPSARAPVRLSDVATVEDGAADQLDIVRVNGRRGVFLRVQKQPGSNTIAVVDAVRAALPTLRGVPASVQAAISFDQSAYIRAAVASLQHEALQGGLLAVLVILVFLLSMRATAIVAVAIPLSVVATFALLYATGQSLNLFTLGGLALGIGRLVDDSIVELENIHRHLVQGESRRSAVLRAAQEVAMPILVSTVTTIVVFIPVLFLTGVARHLFIPLALTISFALVASFFVSRTVTPLLCLKVLPSHEGGGPAFTRRIAASLTAMDEAYERGLQAVLRRRGLSITVILLATAACLLAWRNLASEFFPPSDESQFTVIYKAPVGTRVERTEQIAERVEQGVAKVLGPRGKLWTTMLSDTGIPGGRTALYTSNTGLHTGNLQVNLVPRTQRDDSDVGVMERVRGALKDSFPGVTAFFSTGGIVKRIVNMGAPAPIDVEVLGQDLEAATAYARQVTGAMRGLQDAEGRPVLTDVQLSREADAPELRVVVDRQKAGLLGLTEQDVAQTVLASLVGSSAFTPIRYADPSTGYEYAINVRLADEDRGRIDDLHALHLRSPTGQVVPLDSVARVERSAGPVQIQRRYLQRIVEVTANVPPSGDLGSASTRVQALLEKMAPPEGVTVQLGGQTAAQKEAFRGVAVASLLAIALVYMVLASQFRSLVDPLVIMFSVPLGLAGVGLALRMTGTSLSVNSFMGIIMMVGIVVSNGVLLVDFANVLRRQGRPLMEATVHAARTRLRPILMTSIATVAGLIPMALGLGEGGETNLPLARAVIGGLLVSTFFTLFLVPALYTLLDRFADRAADEDDEEPLDGAEVSHA
ncbi:MAG: Acriflavin resistance protein acrB [Pseudomonadota bacterium]|jgi:hydrophobe/amphiphile efflux-1 (HAE1) family protein